MKVIPVTLKHTARIKTPACEEGVFYQFSRAENIHIWLHGIEFTIVPEVPVTDVLRQMLERSARGRLSLPVVAEACVGEVYYSLLLNEEDRKKLPAPDWKEKITFHGVETELLAVSLDGTPLPTLEEAPRVCHVGLRYVPRCRQPEPGGNTIQLLRVGRRLEG